MAISFSPKPSRHLLRRRNALRNTVAAQVLEERLVLSAPAVTLPVQFEQLRLELGDEQFSEYLQSNKEQFGNLQAIGQDVIDGFDTVTRNHFDAIEKNLQQWLDQFHNPCAPADFDGDGTTQPLTDGILAIRFLAGFRGSSLTADAVNSDRSTDDVEAALDRVFSELDIDGDGESKPLSDGLMLIRHLAGFGPLAVATGAANDSGLRGNPYHVASYIDNMLATTDPIVLADLIDQHASDRTKQAVDSAKQGVADARVSVAQAEGDLETLRGIHDGAKQKIEIAQQKQSVLQGELDEVKQRIEELERLEGFRGGGRNFVNGNEMWVLTNVVDVYIGKVVQNENGTWGFVAADGHVQIFETKEQAEDFARERGDEEYAHIKQDAEAAQEQLPGLRENQQTIEGELQAAKNEETNAVECAKAAALDGASDEKKQRIDDVTNGSTTLDDLTDDVKSLEKAVADANSLVDSAKQALKDAMDAAATEAKDNLDQLISEKQTALANKRDDVARQTILLELAGSMLKQLQIQTSFDSARFADAVRDLGDRAGQLPLNVGNAARIVIQPGGALLGGIIKIQSWLTQKALTGHPDLLREHINGSSEITNWLESRGFENGAITEADAKNIQLYIDHLMGTKTTAQDHLNNWDRCLDQQARELANLQTKHSATK